MNIKDYISSGIIEQYVSGTVSEQERKEVECLSSIYPEIRSHLDVVQSGLEAYVETLKVSAPPALGSSILELIADTPQASSEVIVNQEPASASEDENIRPIEPKTDRATIDFWKIAAGILLLLGAFQFFYFNNQNDKIEESIVNLKETNTELENQIASQEQLAQYNRDLIAVLGDPATTIVSLNSVAEDKNQNATVYWHSGLKTVVINKDNLPALPSDRSYQLWGLQGDTPVDLGVIDFESTDNIQEMRKIDSADAFAITIEPAGGSESPTLEQLQVMGKI